MALRVRKPEWLRVRAPGGERYHELRHTLRGSGLHTVCEHARCPNVGTCWREGTATVMLLGGLCTRRCRFCAVCDGLPGGSVDVDEPKRVADAIATLGLEYVVLTMVTRDDLADGGAGIVAETVTRLRERRPRLLVETLVSDFGGNLAAVDRVLAARPDVFAHNVEVPRAWTHALRDPRCCFDRSLGVLAHALEASPATPTKSSIMVGVGESDDEVREALRELRGVGVSLVTIGQYLQPTASHHPVERFVTPAEFEQYAAFGRDLGFAYVASGPLVRSSYRAAEVFLARRIGAGGARDAAT